MRLSWGERLRCSIDKGGMDRTSSGKGRTFLRWERVGDTQREDISVVPMRVSYCIFADYVYLCALDGVGLGLLCPKN